MITDQKVNAQYIGVYVIGKDVNTSVLIATTIKPNWFRRFMTWFVNGWDWITIEELKRRKGK